MLLVWFIAAVSQVSQVLSSPIAIPAAFPDGEGPDGLKYKTKYNCEGEDLSISCSHDQVIQVIRANFGRFSIAICNRHGTTDWSVNCMAPSSMRVLQRRCDGQTSCTVPVSPSEFGDPCPATPKYLEVHYACAPKSAPSTRRPLPPWFQESGGDQLWKSRIPKLPEGMIESATSNPIRKPILVADLTTPERIPITTPPALPSTTSTTTSTTTTKTTTTMSTANATQEALRQRAADALTTITVGDGPKISDNGDHMEYLPMGSDMPEVDVTVVDIPAEDQPLHCPPSTSRRLGWDWTKAGETAIQECPYGSTGLARWTCGLPADDESPVFWSTSQPDMRDCKSKSMSELETKVQEGEQENVISAALAHLTRSKILYGGDVEAAVAIMRTISNRIQYLLQTQGDTFYNKGAYIQEVLLNMVRVGSNLLDEGNRPAWKDLHIARQMKVATSLLLALEENAFLFVEVTNREEVLVEASKNILMTVSIMEIGHLTNGTELPANNYEEPFGPADDTIELPLAALWDHARNGITKLVHFSFKNLHEILGHAEMSISSPITSLHHQDRSSMSLNSQVISGSLGRVRHIQLPEPVRITLKHLTTLPVHSPTKHVCVFWDHEQSAWSDSGCRTASFNQTHTICECDHLTNFALAMAPEAIAASSPSFSAACVVLIIVKFRKNIHKVLQKTPCLNRDEKHACNPSPAFCTSNMVLNKTLQHQQPGRNSLTHYTLNTAGRPMMPANLLVPCENQGPPAAGPTLMQTQDGQPVMVTLNPYSTQLVDNINRMMPVNGQIQENVYQMYGTAMNPQLAQLTATLRKKKCQGGHTGPCRHPPYTFNIHENSLADSGIVTQDTVSSTPSGVPTSEVVFRAVSPHGHVYWEIDPTRPNKMRVGPNKTHSSDEDTHNDMQNVSDLSDDDQRAASEMSRQSSSRFSESRPLIYSSSASTSPGHSAGEIPRHILVTDQQFQSMRSTWNSRQYPTAGRPVRTLTAPQAASDDLYSYANTENMTNEQIQNQTNFIQIKDMKAVPVSVKSKEYIMAKIANYTERNQV